MFSHSDFRLLGFVLFVVICTGFPAAGFSRTNCDLFTLPSSPSVGALTRLTLLSVGIDASFRSLRDSAREFRRLSRTGIVLRSEGDFFKLIPIDSLVIADILVDEYGSTQIVKGRLVRADSQFILIDVSGQIIKLSTLGGVRGLSSLTVLSQTESRSETRGYVQNFDSISASAQEARRLSRGRVSMEFGIGIDPYQSIPIGSQVLADVMVDEFGVAQLIGGELVGRDRDHLKIRVNGQVKPVRCSSGVGGISALTVISMPEMPK